MDTQGFKDLLAACHGYPGVHRRQLENRWVRLLHVPEEDCPRPRARHLFANFLSRFCALRLIFSGFVARVNSRMPWRRRMPKWTNFFMCLRPRIKSISWTDGVGRPSCLRAASSAAITSLHWAICYTHTHTTILQWLQFIKLNCS